MKNRRRHFFINKPLQFRYMLYLTSVLVIISAAMLIGLYFGIWGGILRTFSDESVRQDILTAARLSQYESVRYPEQPTSLTSLSLFRESAKLSQHQREVFKKILDKTNRELALKLILLFFFIAWGSIFLSHKIAGPLFRFQKTLRDVEKGDLTTRVHLRKFDEAQFLADDFNRALTYLDTHSSRLKNIVNNRSDSGQTIDQIKNELAKIKTSADR